MKSNHDNALDYFTINNSIGTFGIIRYDSIGIYFERRTYDTPKAYLCQRETDTDRGREMSLTDTCADPLTKLEGHDITSAVLIPSTITNSFWTTDKPILLANRYSVELPNEVNVWVPFKVNDFTKSLCNPKKRPNSLTLLFIILALIVVVVIVLIVFVVIYYTNIRSNSSHYSK